MLFIFIWISTYWFGVFWSIEPIDQRNSCLDQSVQTAEQLILEIIIKLKWYLFLLCFSVWMWIDYLVIDLVLLLLLFNAIIQGVRNEY